MWGWLGAWDDRVPKTRGSPQRHGDTEKMEGFAASPVDRVNQRRDSSACIDGFVALRWTPINIYSTFRTIPFFSSSTLKLISKPTRFPLRRR